MDKLIDDALGVGSIQTYLKQVDSIQQYQDRVSSMLEVDLKRLGVQSALDQISNFSATETARIERQILDQQCLIDQVREAWPDQSSYFSLADQAIQAQIDYEKQLLDAYGITNIAATVHQPLQEAIDRALDFTRGLDIDALLGMDQQSLVERLNPVQEQLEKLEKIYREFDFRDGDADDETETKSDRTKVLAGLKLLDSLIFDRLYKVLILWFAINSSSSVDSEQLNRIEGAVNQLAEHHHTIEAFHDELAEGHDLASTVTTTDVYLRTGPSVSNDEILLLQSGTRFLVTREHEEWSAGLAYAQGENPMPGWVHSDFLVPLPSENE